MMAWIYALELFALVICAWRIGTGLGAVAKAIDADDSDDE